MRIGELSKSPRNNCFENNIEVYEVLPYGKHVAGPLSQTSLKIGCDQHFVFPKLNNFCNSNPQFCPEILSTSKLPVWYA